ncbi:MAG: hemerythrin domain-containing protein [Nitrospirae bacterium]|nr:MAG: hemerythrin domain-containing protein [Nitrospirota bacterium]
MDDPVSLLKNDHAVLLGQLALLEQQVENKETRLALLQALMRDCRVHFRREQVLFEGLRTALGSGGQSLDSLVQEHRELEEKIVKLMEAMQGTCQHTIPDPEEIHTLIGQFQTHIRHEETVVFVLAGTRLTLAERQNIANQMLMR